MPYGVYQANVAPKVRTTPVFSSPLFPAYIHAGLILK